MGVSDSSRGRRTPRLKFSDRSRRPLSFKMTKKKGFMTPERKKKLRTLLRKKAAEELKKEQERNASDDELKKIVKEYFDKWFNLEGEMFFCNAKSFSAISRSMSSTCPSAT